MLLNTEMLAAEAERLVAGVEREVERYRQQVADLESQSLDAEKTRGLAHRAELDLKRLQLYRAVLTTRNSAHALMPEYVVARGLVPADHAYAADA